MDITLYLIGIVILIAFAGNVFFKKTKIPEILFLIIIGIIIGPVLGLVKNDVLIIFAPLITSLMLIFVMLDNGLSFDIIKVLRSLPIVTIFTLGMIFSSAILIALVLYFFLNISILISLVLGFTMAGTTTDVITIIISRMKIKEKTRYLMIMESVLNDIQIIPFFILLHFVQSSSINYLEPLISVIIKIPVAIIIGIAAAFLWLYLISRYLGKHPLNYIATIGILLILYNAMETLGSNGSIAILSFSLVLGNALGIFKKLHLKYKLDKNHIKSSMKILKEIELDNSFFIRIIFFVFLGAMFTFNFITWQYVFVSLLILVVIYLSRFTGIFLISRKHKEFKNSLGLVTFVAPRGYIAAILAFTVVYSGIANGQVLNIVLANIFLTTIVSIVYSIYYEKICR